MVSVCFLHVGPLHHYEQKFVDSVRVSMPEAKMIQFTDLETPELEGVHEVRRHEIKAPLWEHRWRAYSEIDGSVICLDTDVLVHEDLSRIFALPFDVALTRRNKPIYDPNGTDITKAMPFNGGVVLSRSHRWLAKVADTCVDLAHLKQDWYTDQMAMTVCARTQPESVLALPCEIYNCTFQVDDPNVRKAWVVHYKGERKKWM